MVFRSTLGFEDGRLNLEACFLWNRGFSNDVVSMSLSRVVDNEEGLADVGFRVDACSSVKL